MDLSRLTARLGLRSAITQPDPPRLPSHGETEHTSGQQALTLGAVFSCVAILATAAEQVSLDATRGDTSVASALVDRPDRAIPRTTWVHQLVTSLALYGNAFLLVKRDSSGQPVAAEILPAHQVAPISDHLGRIAWRWCDQIWEPGQIVHLAYLRVPGRALGLGPIQAAQSELSACRDLARAGHGWFSESGTPSGTITTARDLTPDQGRALMDAWYSVPAGKTRLLTGGATYSVNQLSPKAAQWLESRKFTKTEIADLFGIPASLMLGIDPANSQTYSNIEQDWTGFVRFRLMRYLTEIEEALTWILPRGQRARFNLESLLRTDSRTRMSIHADAISAGIYTPEYARKIEHISEGESS